MKKLLILLAVLVTAGTALAQTVAPTLIPFQGRLTDQNGVAYTNKQYTIVFQLYDQAVGGTLLWSERHEKVGVLNGMVNVFLGSISSLTNVSFASTRYLGITVDGDNNPNTPDPEMVPRQMIIPAFWAKQADSATKLGAYTWTDLLGNNNPTLGIPGSRLQVGSIPAAQLVTNSITAAQVSPGAITGGLIATRTITATQVAAGTITTNELAKAVLDLLVPAGSITAFGGETNNIPAGWLLCDGQAMSSSAYPRLFNAISTNWGSGYTYNGSTWSRTNALQDFNLPDLRGYFLRGVDGNANRDPDKAARVVLGYLGNTGNLPGSAQGHQLYSHNHTLPGLGTVDNAGGPFPHRGGSSASYGQNSSGYTGGNETRPINAYVHYLIKY